MILLYIIILILVGIMVASLKRRNKGGSRRLSRKQKNKLKMNRIIQTQQVIEQFNKQKKLFTDEELKKCHKVLVKHERYCNCFKDRKNNIPDPDINACLKNTDKDPKCNEYNKCKRKYVKLMSNYEPGYDPELWSNPLVEGSHNCYAYFLNDKIPKVINKCRTLCGNNKNCSKKIKECGNLKPQPGSIAAEFGIIDKTNRKYTCKDMEYKVLKDNTDVKSRKEVLHKTSFAKPCPPHHYKGALVVDPNNTYHFYRQDDNSRWSHKQGTLRVENVDASGKPIYAPHLVDLNYNKKKKKDGINYTDFCSYMCIPNNDYLDTHAGSISR